MTSVNLLPPELIQRQVARRTTAMVIAGGVVLLLVVGFFYFVQVMNLSRTQDDLAAQQATNVALQSQVADLQQYAQLQAELAAKQQLLSEVYAGEIQWSGVLLDVSRLIPADEYLTNLTGQISAPTTGATGTAAASLVGSLQFTGTAQGTATLATWLTKLEQSTGWVNAWMNSATESAPYSNIYTFNSGVDLTKDALTPRGREGRP